MKTTRTAEQIKTEAKKLQQLLDRGQSTDHGKMHDLCAEYEQATGEWLWL